MILKNKIARIAGALYLIYMIVFALADATRSKLIHMEDTSATFINIQTSGGYFKIGFVSDIIAYSFSAGGVDTIRVITFRKSKCRVVIPFAQCCRSYHSVPKYAESLCSIFAYKWFRISESLSTGSTASYGDVLHSLTRKWIYDLPVFLQCLAIPTGLCGVQVRFPPAHFRNRADGECLAGSFPLQISLPEHYDCSSLHDRLHR